MLERITEIKKEGVIKKQQQQHISAGLIELGSCGSVSVNALSPIQHNGSFVCRHPFPSNGAPSSIVSKAKRLHWGGKRHRDSLQNRTIHHLSLRSLMHVCTLQLNCDDALHLVIYFQKMFFLFQLISSAWSHHTTADPLNTEWRVRNSKTTTAKQSYPHRQDWTIPAIIQTRILFHINSKIDSRHADAPSIQHRFNPAHWSCKTRSQPIGSVFVPARI